MGAASRIVPAGDEADLCLPQYEIASCGRFLFMKRRSGPQTLRDFLGSYHDLLEEISGYLGEVVHFGGVLHQANWKVLVENVIDILHCPVLHRDTLVAMGFCTKPIPEVEVDGPHTSAHNLRTPGSREKVRQRALSHLDHRDYKHDSFYHIHIFPNLFISSTEGMSFYVGHALPLAAEETLLRVRFLGPRVELSGSGRVRQELLDAQSGASGLRIIEEDRVMLESIQRGLRVSNRPGAVLKGEPRLTTFMDSYSRLMSATAE
jgi:phenylpropionate dioxygenase-like ring-hydroxylating dioxygenase large terminal subunit